MANEVNLIPKDSNQDREEAKRNGIKGGKKSGESRRRKKALRDCISTFTTAPTPDNILATLRKSGFELGDDTTCYEAIAFMLVFKAMQGDMKALQNLITIMGESFADHLKIEELKLKKKELRQMQSIKEEVYQDALSKSLEQLAKDLKSDDAV